MKITSTIRASQPSASSKTRSNPDVVTRDDGQQVPSDSGPSFVPCVRTELNV
jgi:hypothetical protein